MTTNPTYKPSEGKREEFRKYLEKNGIMDALTKVLVNLYEEVDKPENALQFILDKLSLQAGQETHKQLSLKIEEAQVRISELEAQLAELTQSPEGPAAEEAPGEEAPPQEPAPEAPPEENADQPPPE